MGLPALGLGQPGRILTASAIYTPFDGSSNGYIESFNGKLRDELLNLEIFDTLLEAKILIERWRREYKSDLIQPLSSNPQYGAG